MALLACWNVLEAADVLALEDDPATFPPDVLDDPRLCSCPSIPAECLGSKAEAMFLADAATDPTRVPVAAGCGPGGDTECDDSFPFSFKDDVLARLSAPWLDCLVSITAAVSRGLLL